MSQRQSFIRHPGFRILFIFVLASTILTGCMIGVEETVEVPVPLIPPDASGEQLYKMPVLGIQVGCVTCHSLDGSTLLGPSLQGIGSSAQDRIPGMSAEAYIRQSILEPDAYVLEGSEPRIMPPHYEDALTEAQIDALVAFLLSQ